MGLFRSSHQICYIENCVLTNFSNFPGKQLCWSFFLIALQVEISSAKRLLLFVSLQNTITNNSDEFGLDKTWTECKVIFFFKCTEAVDRRCSVKKVFLEISENSQENTCARIFFNKVAVEHLLWLVAWLLWAGKLSCYNMA